MAEDGFIQRIVNTDTYQPSSRFSYKNLEPYVFNEPNIVPDILPTVKDYLIPHPLLRLHFCVSSICNEHCIHCYFPHHCSKDIMSKGLFQDIIQQCIDMKVLNITLSGGEPMINPNLEFFIQECRKHNFSINILSNLTLLSESLIKEFEQTPLLSVQTTLYSMDCEIHDNITNLNGSFIKTKQSIEILHKHNIPMQINCPIMKQNSETYMDVLDWAKSMNIEASSDYMLFGCYDGSKSNLDCRLSLDEVKTLLTHSKYLSDTLNDSNLALNYNSQVCPVCQSSLCISPNGDIYPCEGWQSLILGNVCNETLSDIWINSPKIKRLRSLSKNKTFPKCESCNDRAFCSMCLIRNVNESINLDLRDINPYFCSIAKIKQDLHNSHTIVP